MKTTMKTLQATLLLAAILALAVSCAPEIELTSRDWGQVNADKDSSKYSTGSLASQMLPDFAFDNLTGEMIITFPKQADLLRESNTAIEQKMRDCIKFYSYTNGVSPAPDTLGSEYAYSFINRLTSTTVKIKLNTYTPGSGSSVVAKIIASKYTFSGGKKFGGKGDTQSGTEFYDEYKTIDSGLQLDYFHNPYQRWWSIDIGFDAHYTITGSFESATIVTTNISAADAMLNPVMSDLMNKLSFKLQKINPSGNNWQDVGGANFSYAMYDSNTGTGGDIRVTFIPEDLQTYRVQVGGLTNLTTSAPYYGVTQRIRVTKDGDDSAYTHKTISTWDYTFVDYTNPNRDLLTGCDLIHNMSLVTVGAEGKNVILRFVFEPITPPNGLLPVTIKQMSLANFKKNVKIFYIPEGPRPNNMDAVVYNSDKICYVDIKSIEYDGYSEIKVELNSDYRYDTLDWLGFLIAPGFEYDSDAIVLGNYQNWRYEIDGVKYFDFYGTYTESSYDNPYAPTTTIPGGPSGTGTYSDPIPLTINGPMVNGSITASTPNGELWYSFTPVAWNQYTIYLDDTDNSYNTLDIVVDVYVDGSQYYYVQDGSPLSINPSTKTKVLIRVSPYEGAYTYGTFAIGIEQN